MHRYLGKLIAVCLSGLAVMVASGNSALAQTATTDAVYEDVKKIIEDLLTREVSQTVATHLACLAGSRMATGDTPNAIDISTDLSSGTAPQPKDRFVVLEALSSFPNTLQAVYDQRYSGLKPIVLAELSTFVADLAYQLLRSPVAIRNISNAKKSATPAKAMVTALSQVDPATLTAIARADLLDPRHVDLPGATNEAALAQIDYSPMSNSELEKCGANLAYKLSTKQIILSGTSLDRDCALTNVGRDEYACDLAYAVQETLTGDPADAEKYLIRALAVYVDELAKAPNPTQSQIAATIAILNGMLSDPKTTTTEIVNNKLLESIKTALNLSASPAIKQPLIQLVDQWKAYHLTDGQSLPVTRLQDIVGGISSLVADDCTKTDTPRACTFFKNEPSVLGIEANLWPIVRLAGKGDYVDAGQLGIGILFTGLQKSCASKNNNVTDACQILPYIHRFADDVVVYVVQEHVNGTPTDEARGAIRASAEDLVQELGVKGGIDRKTFSGSGILYPDLALRYEVNPSFARDGSGSARFLASLSLLKARIPIIYTYAAYTSLEFSFVDILAPLAERAARTSSATYVNEDKLWINLVMPRIDIEAGIPALSKHLLLGGGISYRLVGPFLTSAAAAAPATYEYRLCSKDSGWAECLQFGAFIKYAL